MSCIGKRGIVELSDLVEALAEAVELNNTNEHLRKKVAELEERNAELEQEVRVRRLQAYLMPYASPIRDDPRRAERQERARIESERRRAPVPRPETEQGIKDLQEYGRKYWKQLRVPRRAAGQ